MRLAAADVLITCTGAAGGVFDTDRVARATADGRPVTVIDLALPRDVAHEVRTLANVSVIDLEVLAAQAPAASVAARAATSTTICPDWTPEVGVTVSVQVCASAPC